MVGNRVVRSTTVVSKLVDQSSVQIPVVEIAGRDRGPSLLVVGGVHGDEPVGARAVLALADELSGEDIRGSFIGVPIVNTPAFIARKRGNPIEDWYYDMNRIFPGSPTGSITQRIAHTLVTELLPRADLMLNIHSGGQNLVNPHRVILPSVRHENVRLGQSLGEDWTLLTVSEEIRSSLAASAEELGIPSLTIEIGGISSRFPDDWDRDWRDVVKLVRNVMQVYGMLEGVPSLAREFSVVSARDFRSSHGGLLFLRDGFSLMAEVKEQQELMEIVDFLGNTVEQVRAPYDGTIVGMPAQPMVSSGGCWLYSLGRVTHRIAQGSYGELAGSSTYAVC